MLQCRIQKKLNDFSLDLSFQVNAETLVIAGPSGNGKSMTLRSIAGLAVPDSGRILIGERPIFDHSRRIHLPPERRNIGFVFQNYALFPHLTVYENVSYGLRTRKITRSEKVERVKSMLENLNIAHLRDRMPSELSGGEQQRTALARALVLEPSVLLLDEPLSALDVTTRGRVRKELKKLLGSLDIPTIFVTHDYEDALSLGDRILVLERGKIIQDGTASELLNCPRSPFVADFSGSNYFDAEIIGTDNGLTKATVWNEKRQLLSSEPAPNGEAAVMVFPWDVRLSKQEPKGAIHNRWPAKVTNVLEYGNRLRVDVEGEIPLTAEIDAGSTLREGDKVFVEILDNKVHLIEKD